VDLAVEGWKSSEENRDNAETRNIMSSAEKKRRFLAAPGRLGAKEPG
jgi:hypothetical protein